MIYLELFISFALIGFTSFGGMSMIPLTNDQMISHRWMTMQEVADIVAIAEMTPGPLGLNCATFAGHRTAGVLGALCATAGVLLPSLSVAIVAAAMLSRFRESRTLARALYGIRPVMIGMIAAIIVQQAMTNYVISGSVSPATVLIGAVSLVLLVHFKWSVPRTILVAAALGLALCRG